MTAIFLRWDAPAAIERVWHRPCGFPHRLVGLSLLLLVGVLAGSAWTKDGPPRSVREPLSFRIPSQPLASALQAYSQTTGIEVLYESAIADGLQSTEVEGVYAPKLALGILLTNTDLLVHYIRSDAITLSLPSVGTYDLPPMSPLADVDLALDTLRVADGQRPDAGRLREFSESVQTDIERALRSDSRTKTGNYRANLKLWVDSSRVVSRVELAQSTGDIDRDASIATILQGLMLRSGPPANTPQPVRVAILVRSL
jgi:hypothetical protein